MKRFLMIIGFCCLAYWAGAQSISPSGIYGASSTSLGGGVSVSWVLGSLTPEAMSALPVKLIDFQCALTDAATVSLTWSTSEETSSDYFLIQHSTNGKHWAGIGHLKANGESNAVKTYAFEHSNPAKGENLYRLQMVDQDGTYAYSRVRNVVFEAINGLSFHPNPVSDWLTVDAKDWVSMKELKVTNIAGATVGAFREEQLQKLPGKAINFQDFPSGIYIISITRKDGSVHSEKIFKN
ncbi:T9SS type A sorting domain-containing protein [Dyadobacter fanqingshengii]|uniref:T9SS type A sorting domain-containing protein n=1 Tax=Dyadobacter fanqingshengii TaxID=2906443 RepID=A0A9X1PDK0_9BACT|nr:T9SS type A sorting domain-containing protein [Dyadobacter fanqingshengii]MCF0041685.1 T9SS type A sorting domain-containing protein [Dyadobacter fanqingshengii]USJ36601.1 T9SS type A sorting domain-containing protein [Dyadobacter fanqingshengii]